MTKKGSGGSGGGSLWFWWPHMVVGTITIGLLSGAWLPAFGVLLAPVASLLLGDAGDAPPPA